MTTIEEVMVNFRIFILHPPKRGVSLVKKQSYFTKLILIRFLGYLPNIWTLHFFEIQQKMFFDPP